MNIIRNRMNKELEVESKRYDIRGESLVLPKHVA